MTRLGRLLPSGLVSVMILLAVASSAYAEPDVICDSDSDSFYVPQSGTEVNRPVLFILSCTGAVPHDLDSNRVIADSLGWITVGCHASRNHRSYSENDVDIVKTYEKLVRDYSIDGSRIYICGFSGMGAQALYEVISHPELFRGAISSCSPWREFPAPDPTALGGHAVYLISREKDWNLQGNQYWKLWFEGLGVATELTVTPGEHEPGGTDELLTGTLWVSRSSQ